MRMLVVGSDGQLGHDFLRLGAELGYRAEGLSESEIDVADRDSVTAALATRAFDVLVNTAAYHGPDAYRDPHPGRFYAVNVQGPYFLAECAAQHGASLVHFSTDYVFSGNALPVGASFAESDLARPASLYAASKLAGEQIVGVALERHFVFRVASLYGLKGCRAKGYTNFVETVIRRLSAGRELEVVGDVVMSPTSTRAVVGKVVGLLGTEQYGLYHLAGSGSCSWYEFALAVADYLELPTHLLKESSSDRIAQDTARGRNTALRNERLLESPLGDLAPWRENLHAYLDERRLVGGPSYRG